MKILFVVKDIHLFEPFGIMHISSMLKTRGHEVDSLKTASEDIDAKIKSFKPRIIAYSLTTGYHQYYIDINRRIKRRYDIFSIFGGPHPTFFPEMINEKSVDAVCIGEGELPMLDLADALSGSRSIEDISNLIVKSDDGIKINPNRDLIKDLDTLPFPDRELFYRSSPVLKKMKIKTFFSGRGCPYRCSYCFNDRYNQLFKNKGNVIRKRSVDNLLREIMQVKETYPTEVIRFGDDVFTLGGEEWLEEFSRKYKKMIGLPFVCMARANLVNDDMVKTLKDAGCHSVYMAIEAGNDRIRNELLKRNLTKEQHINASRLFHKYNIKLVAQNIIGLPSETMEDMLETLRLNIKCRIDFAIASIFNPYPGTELSVFAKENGYFSGDYTKIDHSYFANSPLNFTKSQKRKIRNLSHLFGITTNFPALFPFINLLTAMPLGKIFKGIGELWYAYCLKFRVFPFRLTNREFIGIIGAFLKRNRA